MRSAITRRTQETHMETVTIHHRPGDPRSADLMLRMAIMSRSPSWPERSYWATGKLWVFAPEVPETRS